MTPWVVVGADAAGVAFTADPVTGALDVTIVSAVRGAWPYYSITWRTGST